MRRFGKAVGPSSPNAGTGAGNSTACGPTNAWPTSAYLRSLPCHNRYKIWNWMSSGRYFPPPVKAVEIPKKSGGVRILGMPTVADRITQTVVKLTFEPLVEPIFHPDSYGYRPGRSAHNALVQTRKRCWRYNWVLEFLQQDYELVSLIRLIPSLQQSPRQRR